METKSTLFLIVLTTAGGTSGRGGAVGSVVCELRYHVDVAAVPAAGEEMHGE